MSKAISDLSLIEDIDWARLAAYIDGEGCIRIAACKGGKHRKRRILFIEMSISNTDIRLVEWLRSKFAGSISVSKRQKKHWANKFTWSVSSRRAFELLTRALPWFIIKREQAEEAISFQRTIRRWGVKGAPDDVVLQQWRHKERLQLLKGTASKRTKEILDAEKLLPRTAG